MSPQDLRAISLYGLQFVGPPGNDHFKYSDLTFARIFGCSFRDATFFGTVFDHARLKNVMFTHCTFVDVSFYGVDAVDVRWEDCDFVSAGIVNASMQECAFTSCHTEQAIFSDCRFDDGTKFSNWRGARLNADPKDVAGQEADFDRLRAPLYAGLQEGYAAAGVSQLARRYFFERNRAATRYITPWNRRGARFLFELTAGYGVRPLRTLGALLVALLLSIVYFTIRYESSGPLLAAGAFFTFGARSDLLSCAPLVDVVVYILTAGLGIAGIAAFITLLANTLLRFD